MESENIEQVDSFEYLRSYFTEDVLYTNEIKVRIAIEKAEIDIKIKFVSTGQKSKKKAVNILLLECEIVRSGNVNAYERGLNKYRNSSYVELKRCGRSELG